VPDVDGGPAIFDVTADIEAFQSGTANRGWLVLPASGGAADAWTMKSSEYTADTSLRPSLEVTYTPIGNAYTQWASGLGLTAGNSAPTDDPDLDGAVNLIEFAFNLNPLLSDAEPAAPAALSGLPNGGAVVGPDGMVMELNFLRRKPPAGTGLTYEAQFGDTLTDWGPGHAPTVAPVNGDWERVTVHDNVAAGPSRRFARMLVRIAF